VELFHLLNPINHADTPESVRRYKVEPYVIAADIYSVSPHIGRGGWTWYTGSAAWMYRLGIDAILGITRTGDSLTINPCIPRQWPGFKADYRFGSTHYKIRVENPNGVNQGIQQVFLDGKLLPDHSIILMDDAVQHDVQVILG
jgi:cyclic beta-1,2-glucan synthetase